MEQEYTIKNSEVSPLAKLFFRCNINSSKVADNVIVGDMSRLTSSELAEYVKIDRYNLIYHTQIGRYSYTGPFDMIFKAKIGSFSSISYGVTIGPPEHDYKRLTTHPFLYDPSYNVFSHEEILPQTKFDKEIIIGSDVWIGCNATILRGIHVGDGAVIGANSLVNKDVPPYAIVAGDPARIIKFRFPEDKIQELLEMKWWDWPIEKIKENRELFLNKVVE